MVAISSLEIRRNMERWEKIENAYHGARDLRGEDRSHFLDQWCGSDDAMRRQVEALLAQDDNPNSFLDRPAEELSSEWRSWVRNVGTLTGRRVGPYEILEPIGSGGMGDVYRARDTKLQRAAALKFLPVQLGTDPGRLARFEREARTLAALNHPNIAGIYGLEESDAGQALALELVEGPTLGDRIAQSPIPIEEVLSIARQIAEALKAAHDQGFIHRDLKPANIKLRPDGTVKVLDFGLAKALEPVAGIKRSLTPSPSGPATTQVGVILGTAAYMSPEQVTGRSADQRCDVWAFGCVLYEMLSGRRAFPGDDVSDTLAAVLRDKPDWSALPTTVPAQIRTLVEGCLTKDRKKCIADFSTVQFLLNGRHLEAPAAGQSLARRQPWDSRPKDRMTPAAASQHSPASLDRLVELIKGLPRRVLVVGLVSLALLLVSVGLRYRSVARARANSGAVIGRLVPQAEGEQRESRLVNAEAHGLFLQGIVAARRENYEGYKNAIRYTQRGLEKQPDFAAAYARMARYYVQFLFMGPMAPKKFMPDAEAAARKAVEFDDTLAEGHAVLALVLFLFEWDWSSSEMEYRRALGLNANLTEGHRNFAGLLSATGRHEEALIEAQRALELDPMSIQAGLDLGRTYRAARQYDRAIAELRKVVEKDPSIPRAHFQLGQTYIQKGMVREGIGELEAAVKLKPDVPNFSSCLAYAYAVSGRTFLARAILETLTPRNGPNYVSPTAIARIYVGLGDKRAALAWLEKAYEERDFDLIDPNANTGLVELRSDPYYHEIFARMGLFQ
jgi:serine/threonine protein kinase/Flp pilus assembly protein TadD